MHAGIRPDSLDEKQFQDLKIELKMEFASAIDQYYYAITFDKPEAADKYFKWTLKSAIQGDHDAQSNVGYCYWQGYGTTQNEKLTFDWSLKAAKQGNTVACHSVGMLYLRGNAVPFNLQLGYEFLTKAKPNYTSNNPKRHIDFSFGLGILEKQENNYQKAFEYFTMSNKLDYAPAQYELALCYLFGRGCDINKSQAIDLLQRSAAQKFPPAILQLHELNM